MLNISFTLDPETETYAMDFAKRLAPNASNSLVAWGFERMTNGGNGKPASKN